jgi:integral membrane protein
MAVYADDEDTSTELERKVAALRVVCLVETVSYLILMAFWIYWLGLGGSRLGVQMFGSLHGMVFLAFAAMVFGVHRPMGWSRGFLAVALLTGPIGAICVYWRIRRDGVPGRA